MQWKYYPPTALRMHIIEHYPQRFMIHERIRCHSFNDIIAGYGKKMYK